MIKVIGGIFKLLGVFAFVIFGLWGFIIELAIVKHIAGFWGVVIGLAILPVTFLAAPWYAFIAYGNSSPLLIVYGGGILAYLLFYIGKAIAGDNER